MQTKNTKSIRNLSALDLLVIFLCISGIALLLILFWQNLNRSLERQNEQPVGVIVIRRNTAQRRLANSLLWDRLQNQSPIYSGDIIRTSSASEATIAIHETGDFEVLENTMVQISLTRDRTELDVSGSLVASAFAEGRQIAIHSGGTTTTMMGGAKASISIIDNYTTIRPIEGAVFVKNGGVVRQLDKGDVLSIMPCGSESQNPRIGVLSPGPVTRMLVNSSHEQIYFSFRKIDFSDEKIRLDISGERRFGTLVGSWDIDYEQFTILLPPGNYWWRAYPVSADGTGSPLNAASGSIVINNISPPRLISPAHGTHLPVNGSSAVTFRWAEMQEAYVYILEAADNQEMLNPVISEIITSPIFRHTGLPEGHWYWRVSPVFSSAFTGSGSFVSQTARFSLGGVPPIIAEPEPPPSAPSIAVVVPPPAPPAIVPPQPEPQPEPPVIVTPQPEPEPPIVIVVPQPEPEPPVVVVPPQPEPPVVVVVPQPEPEPPAVVVPPQPEPVPPVIVIPQPEPAPPAIVIAPQPVAPRPFPSEQTAIPPSAFLPSADDRLRPPLRSPQHNSTIRARDLPANRFDLTWSAVPGAHVYLVFIFDNDGRQILRTATYSTSFTIDLNYFYSGIYRWEIQALVMDSFRRQVINRGVSSRWRFTIARD